MNKYAKKVLKYLNKNSPKLYSAHELSSKFNIDHYFANEVLKELIDDQLVTKKNILKSNGISTSAVAHYRSTLKGIDYFKNNIKLNLTKFLYSFLNSIFCPIIVSIITTLITIWISKLFGAE